MWHHTHNPSIHLSFPVQLTSPYLSQKRRGKKHFFHIQATQWEQRCTCWTITIYIWQLIGGVVFSHIFHLTIIIEQNSGVGNLSIRIRVISCQTIVVSLDNISDLCQNFINEAEGRKHLRWWKQWNEHRDAAHRKKVVAEQILSEGTGSYDDPHSWQPVQTAALYTPSSIPHLHHPIPLWLQQQIKVTKKQNFLSSKVLACTQDTGKNRYTSHPKPA